MHSRQRFLRTLSYQSIDRVPFLEEGIREEVLVEWYSQGLPRETDLNELFHYDLRDEIDADLEPRPYPQRWPRLSEDLGGFKRRLNPNDRRRLPRNWKRLVKAWQRRDFPLILNVHQGFFLTMGVGDWKRFYEAIYLTKDQPALVQGMLEAQGYFAARLAERILGEVKVDAVLFSEPIGGNNGPIISPSMYRDFVLSSYQPIMEVVRKFQVPLVIMRTYANPRPLLDDIFNLGINCLWACETPEAGMDLTELRQIYGRELRLIGGIDADALRSGPEAIKKEVARVPELLAQGGYIPLLDGRVRVDVPYGNYVYYRKLLEQVTSTTEKLDS
jgi:uroporphyrinogen decarboxylase